MGSQFVPVVSTYLAKMRVISSAPALINGAAESHLLSGLNIHTSLCNYFISHVDDLFEESPDQRTSLIIQGDINRQEWGYKW